MSICARIGLQLTDKTIKSVYCHQDGYLKYTGAILKEFYKDYDSVKALIDLGDLSLVGETIGKEVDFDTYSSIEAICDRKKNGEKEQTIAYHRDRKEPLRFECYNTIEDYIHEYSGSADYVYLFKDNKWYVYSDEIEEFINY